MSFDLLVWDSDDAMTDEQAAAFVQSLNDQADGDLFGEIADPSERIVSFVTYCANRWPGESEASPWASWPIQLTDAPVLRSVFLLTRSARMPKGTPRTRRANGLRSR